MKELLKYNDIFPNNIKDKEDEKINWINNEKNRILKQTREIITTITEQRNGMLKILLKKIEEEYEVIEDFNKTQTISELKILNNIIEKGNSIAILKYWEEELNEIASKNNIPIFNDIVETCKRKIIDEKLWTHNNWDGFYNIKNIKKVKEYINQTDTINWKKNNK